MAEPKNLVTPLQTPAVTPVQVVAAILLAGHLFRKSVPENELQAVANKYVTAAKVIVDASNQ